MEETVRVDRELEPWTVWKQGRSRVWIGFGVEMEFSSGAFFGLSLALTVYEVSFVANTLGEHVPCIMLTALFWGVLSLKPNTT